MPQASDELRGRMRAKFGSIDEAGPMKFLTDAGYTLTRAWTWTPKPGVTSWAGVTYEEGECIDFLIYEWDFGGLEV